ncbi:MAG: LuxR C-terminal-related transcriptional regulator [Bacteroidia bacterium]|nr:LuxR C-terminal-related transcriptional regulator [Bacteroidia bacterium]
MSANEFNQIAETFQEILSQFAFVEAELDYSNLEKHKPLLKSLASLSDSGINVFDIFKKEHVFYSPNYGVLLGYDWATIMEEGQTFLDRKIHPDDYLNLMISGISAMKLSMKFSTDEKANIKFINEYRILNSDNKYVRVIEQHQILEMDRFGNAWLMISIIDISPNQDVSEGFKSQLFNFRTGHIIPFHSTLTLPAEKINVVLTKRELEILDLVKKGFLSKEISDKLSISVHTVNTHRQRFLEKLGANNSFEAVILASNLGLL